MAQNKVGENPSVVKVERSRGDMARFIGKPLAVLDYDLTLERVRNSHDVRMLAALLVRRMEAAKRETR